MNEIYKWPAVALVHSQSSADLQILIDCWPQACGHGSMIKIMISIYLFIENICESRKCTELLLILLLLL